MDDTPAMTAIATNLTSNAGAPNLATQYALWLSDTEAFLDALPRKPLFDLVLTSPPYLVGKSYEKQMKKQLKLKEMTLDDYLAWQERVFRACVLRLKPKGSICWQVGTHIAGGQRSAEVVPLDLLLYPRFSSAGVRLRNRIVWSFGHGLHCHYRFSGRHETILWYTADDDYHFNLDAVRVPQKYPGKTHFRPGEKHGTYSGNILGKNPSDVWHDIPNVKGKHPEKTAHPCQFPVALAERLVRALAPTKGLVFDPFAGVASAGVAAIRSGRRFWGCELLRPHVMTGLSRMRQAIQGVVPVRPLERPIFDPAKAGRRLTHRSDQPLVREA